MRKAAWVAGTMTILIISAILIARILSGEDNWICRDGQWIRHGHPSAPASDRPCGEAALLRQYLSEHISELSSQKEVLGGKFYLTDVKIIKPGTATVEYEDGHIALRAMVNYRIHGEQVEILKFEIAESRP